MAGNIPGPVASPYHNNVRAQVVAASIDGYLRTCGRSTEKKEQHRAISPRGIKWEEGVEETADVERLPQESNAYWYSIYS
jgi:hypothetical protein